MNLFQKKSNIPLRNDKKTIKSRNHPTLVLCPYAINSHIPPSPHLCLTIRSRQCLLRPNNDDDALHIETNSNSLSTSVNQTLEVKGSKASM